MINSKTTVRTGRILCGFLVLFLLFDSIVHMMNPPFVVDAFAKLGYPASLAPVLGIIEIVSIALYIVPRTSVLGAILLTGYLGGATAAQLRIESPSLFSVIVGVLLWVGLVLQNDRLRALLPWDTNPRVGLYDRGARKAG